MPQEVKCGGRDEWKVSSYVGKYRRSSPGKLNVVVEMRKEEETDMDQLREALLEKKEELDKIIEHATNFLEKAPKGSLRITHNKGTVQYYLRSKPSDRVGTYIKKKEKKIIADLAQKDYEEKVLSLIRNQKAALERIIATYEEEQLMKIYETMSEDRKKLVQPYIVSDEKFIQQWKQAEYKVAYDPDEGEGIYTENGEAVRSKSEKILADKFKLMNIPYHYEKPLYLHGYGEVHPDFTVLNKRTRKTYYWEHLGLMDNKDYSEKAIKKIETMEKNGIFPGDNLILTYETMTHHLNMRTVDLLIRKYLL